MVEMLYVRGRCQLQSKDRPFENNRAADRSIGRLGSAGAAVRRQAKRRGNAGQPLSSEIKSSGVPTLLVSAEGNIGQGDRRKSCPELAESKTLSMRGNSLHGSRKVPSAPIADGAIGRSEKVSSCTSDMHPDGKSDGPTVLKKLPNNGEPESPEEAVKGRRPTKGNTAQTTAARTQSRSTASIGLCGVREAAKKDRKARFIALLHHVSVGLLWDSFYALKRQAAPVVNGVTRKDYQEGLEQWLHDLHECIHRGIYRAQPSKRTYIPKPDRRIRPLGIAAFEDKIVQHVLVTVLNAVYGVDFLGFSYGFRPGALPTTGWIPPM